MTPSMQEALVRGMVWAIFFASSVYGHVALKVAVTGGEGYAAALRSAATSFWGWSTVVAWAVSCLFWLLAIARQPLVSASSVSALSYVLILAASVIWLGERITAAQLIGAGLIVSGILLVKG